MRDGNLGTGPMLDFPKAVIRDRPLGVKSDASLPPSPRPARVNECETHVFTSLVSERV